MLPNERWIDELDRQISDPFVIDDPSLGTAQLLGRVRALRQMRGAGRDRVLRALIREVVGLADVCPRRFDMVALSAALQADVVASRDSEITLIGAVPLNGGIPILRDSEPTLLAGVPVLYAS
jgi:hypothetical protein